jgi:SAM-dependent methyltransferase
MNLLDLLSCPACRGSIVRREEVLHCVECSRTYPWNNGVPIMVLDPGRTSFDHERMLGVRPGYSRWKERVVLKSLTDRHVVLDFGAGRQGLDDPCIIRMDLQLTPFVDVVGDAHALPFKSDSIDFAFGGAVMEHLANPTRAIDELYRVVRPGGYVYADWAFVFAYHGYPHHYFNATVHGIRNAFNAFRVLETGVAPFHGGAFMLRSVIETYLGHFRPRTLREHWFAADLERILWAPLDDFEQRFDPDDRFRIAAAVYAFAVKQPRGDERLIPDVLMNIYERSPDLRARFPEPLNLAVPDNVMLWAKTEGAAREPALADWLASEPSFCKWIDQTRPYDRGTIRHGDPGLMDAVDPQPPQECDLGEWFGRRRTIRLPFGWSRQGPIGMARRRTEALLRWAGLLGPRPKPIDSEVTEQD